MELARGAVIGGKYRLEEPIGKGGMASVWRATHTELDAPVAVKLLEAFGSSKARMTARFVREAKLAANIAHRNIVRILDYGMVEDSEQPFMVMELLEGESLAARFESTERPLTDIEICEILIQVLGGLAAVHDAGIVHRDIKPENVFLARDPDGEYPKLLDFGISRSLGDTDEARMTSTGMVVGTPLYMSPEQARGLRDIDTRTDLWSVGIILYEGLTGDVPFDSENMGDILIQVATERVPPLDELRPDLPAALSSVVMRALTKDRTQRWQDARAMRDGLRAAVDALASGQTVVPRPGRRATPKSIVSVGRGISDAAPWEGADTHIDVGEQPAHAAVAASAGLPSTGVLRAADAPAARLLAAQAPALAQARPPQRDVPDVAALGPAALDPAALDPAAPEPVASEPTARPAAAIRLSIPVAGDRPRRRAALWIGITAVAAAATVSVALFSDALPSSSESPTSEAPTPANSAPREAAGHDEPTSAPMEAEATLEVTTAGAAPIEEEIGPDQAIDGQVTSAEVARAEPPATEAPTEGGSTAHAGRDHVARRSAAQAQAAQAEPARAQPPRTPSAETPSAQRASTASAAGSSTPRAPAERAPLPRPTGGATTTREPDYRRDLDY
ncbi:MAG: protein kinase [Sandaracinaceae bacterium]